MVLADEQRMVRDAARAFSQSQLAPFAAERDRAHAFPREALHEMGRLGLLGMFIPMEWNGAGVDHVSHALALEEIAPGGGRDVHDHQRAGTSLDVELARTSELID